MRRDLKHRVGDLDFAEAMRFVNRMADVAEAEGHHPDFCVHYREVDVTLAASAQPLEAAVNE